MKKTEKQAVIYAVKSGDTYHYIGKTIQVNMNGEVSNCRVGKQYVLPELREVFVNNEVSVEKLSTCSTADWYDEKLSEVVDKHKQEHPLLNAKWMLEGKRGVWEGTHGSFEEGGYWSGKKRDEHTLKRLSESKFKPVLQYDQDGNFVRQWESMKAVSLAIFGDYRVKGSGGRTKLYSVLKNRNPKRHLKHGSYWFDKSNFKRVPKHLDIEKMYRKYLKQYPRKPITHLRQYSIEHYVNGKLKTIYPNVVEASKCLGVHRTTIAKICRGMRNKPMFDLRYGEKTLQPISKK